MLIRIGKFLRSNGASSGFDDFDEDYRLIVTIALIRGFTPPSFSQQIAQNSFMGKLKALGVWNKLDFLYVFAHDGSSGFGTVNWKNPTGPGATLTNAPLFEPNVGFGTDGVSSRIDTPFTLSSSGVNYTLNNASVGYFNPFPANNPQSPLGLASVAIGTSISISATGATLRMNSGSNIGVVTTVPRPADTIGMISMHRTSATDVTFFADDQIDTVSINSTILPGTTFTFLRRGETYSSPAQRVAMGFAGASLVAEAPAFSEAAKEYMDSL